MAAVGLPGNFSPYADDFNFLLCAYILTEVGVTAYQGAAPFITSKTHLSDPRSSQHVRLLDATCWPP